MGLLSSTDSCELICKQCLLIFSVLCSIEQVHSCEVTPRVREYRNLSCRFTVDSGEGNSPDLQGLEKQPADLANAKYSWTGSDVLMFPKKRPSRIQIWENNIVFLSPVTSNFTPPTCRFFLNIPQPCARSTYLLLSQKSVFRKLHITPLNLLLSHAQRNQLGATLDFKIW